MNPGEYSQPLVRSFQNTATLVNGYTTARLHVDWPSGTVYPCADDRACDGLFENTGDTQATVQLRETDDPISGLRSNLGSAVVLKAGGRQTSSFTPSKPYIEVTCTSGGPSVLRFQVQSRYDWTLLGFSKTDSLYPGVLR